ncbi:MAG: formate hydrogenlyase [gamma proteobacterium symbiont of Lucinoma myriamae]|nr:formate hydrogenlyase [gamma proteobacterium symbiont of Lucinoma myriamae]MCU7832520.1 formate hydrogenlyase [gamma proteobacterium symbiont of Lucinoma myriamae]
MLLATSVLLWIASAGLLHASSTYSSDERINTYFMLTLAGDLGAILATDLVTFFVFLTLMGYGFYALLVAGEGEGEEKARQSGRVYLGFMILADLVLFEALLIAGTMTDDLGFSAVHDAMAQSPSLELYLLMVLIGFAIKAALWPLHFWLTLVFRSSRPAEAVLLGGVPIAIGLLGMARWLPLGEIISPNLGMFMQSLGVIALFYTILSGLIRAQLRMLPAYISTIATGIFAIAMGAGLSDTAVWNQYENMFYIFIASFAIVFAVLVMATRWWESKYACRITPVKQSDYLSLWFKQYWPAAINHVKSQAMFDGWYRLCAKLDFLWQKCLWNRILKYSEHTLQHWTIAITLFLLLGIIIVLISVRL